MLDDSGDTDINVSEEISDELPEEISEESSESIRIEDTNGGLLYSCEY